MHLCGGGARAPCAGASGNHCLLTSTEAPKIVIKVRLWILRGHPQWHRKHWQSKSTLATNNNYFIFCAARLCVSKVNQILAHIGSQSKLCENWKTLERHCRVIENLDFGLLEVSSECDPYQKQLPTLRKIGVALDTIFGRLGDLSDVVLETRNRVPNGGEKCHAGSAGQDTSWIRTMGPFEHWNTALGARVRAADLLHSMLYYAICGTTQCILRQKFLD